MTDWHHATLLQAADAIRTRKVSPVELTRALLDRIARLDPSLHSYATVTSALALEQAARAETEIAAGRYRGPLHGIPIAVKDICNTAGIVTAAGMALHKHTIPDFDATVVKRLVDAGAVLLGKLPSVRRQNIWHIRRRKLTERGLRLGFGFRRRACGVASVDVRWSVA